MIDNDHLDQIDWDITLFALADNGEPMSWNLFLALIPLALSHLLFYQPQSAIVRWGLWVLLGITAAASYSRFHALAEAVFHRLGSNGWVSLIIALLSLALVVGAIRFPVLLKQVGWWIGAAIFIVFLPNAAYILTDFVHLVLDIRKGYPIGTVMLFLIPQYLLFIIVGFEAYVISILNLEFYLLKLGLGQFIVLTELVIHGLSAVAIYLGRFKRFNSWDLLAHPDRLLHLIQTLVLSRHTWAVIAVLFVILFFSHWLLKRITLGLMQQKHAFRALR